MAMEEDNIRRTTTPAYRAPEMWDLMSRHRIDTKVDIWVGGSPCCLVSVLCTPCEAVCVLHTGAGGNGSLLSVCVCVSMIWSVLPLLVRVFCVSVRAHQCMCLCSSHTEPGLAYTSHALAVTTHKCTAHTAGSGRAAVRAGVWEAGESWAEVR